MIHQGLRKRRYADLQVLSVLYRTDPVAAFLFCIMIVHLPFTTIIVITLTESKISL